LKKHFLIIALALFSCCAVAQETDTLSFQEKVDSVIEASNIFIPTGNDHDSLAYSAPADTLAVQRRAFDGKKLQELKEDPDLDYTQKPTVAESLWDRFLRWLGRFIESLFEGATETDWGKVIIYVLAVVLIAVIVMTILKVDAFRVLFFGGDARMKHQVLEENIHEMDFEKLINEAIQQSDFRRGVRLLFLYSLKLLSDKNVIQWEMGKTNHDYMAEINRQELRPGFNQLSYYFDYAWYGNFNINRQTFDRANDTFNEIKNKLNGVR
jgi:hypothetical protein